MHQVYRSRVGLVRLTEELDVGPGPGDGGAGVKGWRGIKGKLKDSSLPKLLCDIGICATL